MATAEETQDMDKAQPVLYLHCTEASPKREEKDGGFSALVVSLVAHLPPRFPEKGFPLLIAQKKFRFRV